MNTNPPPSPDRQPDDPLDARLADRLDAALKQLPPVTAPRALSRNVLALIEARANRPWWQKAWWDWPLGARVAFAIVAVLLGATLSSGGFVLGEGATSYSQVLLERVESPELSAYPASLEPIVNAGLLLWEQGSRPLLLGLGGLAVMLYLACIGLGTACFQFLQKRS